MIKTEVALKRMILRLCGYLSAIKHIMNQKTHTYRIFLLPD